MKGMFSIYGGATEFNQWEQDKLVENSCMEKGDEVVFRNSHGETYVVKAFEQDGKILADVPNYLLRTAGNILVDLGQGSERHTECRTTFTIVAKDKPEGYDCKQNFPDRQPKVASSWNDLADKPFGEEHAFEPISYPDMADPTEEYDLSSLFGDDSAIFIKINTTLPDVGTYDGSTAHIKWHKNVTFDKADVGVEGVELYVIHCETISGYDQAGNDEYSTAYELYLLVVHESMDFIPQGVYMAAITGFIALGGEGVVVISKSRTKTLDEKFMPTLTSPNGTKYKLTVDDSGAVSAVEV